LGGGLTAGDAATQRLLAAAEILESDLWQQDNELALGNEAFQQVLQVPDGDMPSRVNQEEGFTLFNELLDADCWDAGCCPAKTCTRQLAFDLQSLTLNG